MVCVQDGTPDLLQPVLPRPPLYQRTPSFQVSRAPKLGVILGFFPSPTSRLSANLDGLCPIQSCPASDRAESPPLPFPGATAALSSHLDCSPPPDHFPHFRSYPFRYLFCTQQPEQLANLIQSVLCSKPSMGLAPAFPSADQPLPVIQVSAHRPPPQGALP